MPYTNIEDIKAAMKEMDGRDCDVYWWISQIAPTKGEIVCGLNVNDLFFWATAAIEYLEPEDLPLMRQCKKDCIGITGNDCAAIELFACRKRKLRPQKPCYKSIHESLWSLFDACGGEQGDRG